MIRATETIAVWRVALDPGPLAVAEAWAVLPDDERARARGLRFAHDRRRFIVSRAAVRRILAAEVGIPAGALVLVRGPYGRPELAPGGPSTPRFNATRSGDLALVAVSRREVGVDVERVRPLVDLDAVASIVLSTDELASLGALHGKHRLRAFYTAWTVKEARLKAAGTGLATDPRLVPLPRVEASADPALLDGRWHVRTLEPAAGYIGSVVSEGPDWAVHLRTYDACRA